MLKLEADKSSRQIICANDFVADPLKDGSEVKVVDVIQKASVKLQSESTDDPEIEAEIRTMLGSTYQNLGIYDSAATELTKALNLNIKIYGDQRERNCNEFKEYGIDLSL